MTLARLPPEAWNAVDCGVGSGRDAAARAAMPLVGTFVLGLAARGVPPS